MTHTEHTDESHLVWEGSPFLAVAARHKVDVLAYEDEAVGVMPSDVTPMRITTITLSRVRHSRDPPRRARLGVRSSADSVESRRRSSRRRERRAGHVLHTWPSLPLAALRQDPATDQIGEDLLRLLDVDVEGPPFLCRRGRGHQISPDAASAKSRASSACNSSTNRRLAGFGARDHSAVSALNASSTGSLWMG